MTTEKAKHTWKNILSNTNTHTEVEDGEMVRRPTTLDSEQARAKCSHILQVVKGHEANFDNKLERKWSKHDLCGSEFAIVLATVCGMALLPDASKTAP